MINPEFTLPPDSLIGISPTTRMVIQEALSPTSQEPDSEETITLITSYLQVAIDAIGIRPKQTIPHKDLALELLTMSERPDIPAQIRMKLEGIGSAIKSQRNYRKLIRNSF